MKSLVSLGFDTAIEAIKNETQVMYKSGVWNRYSLTSVENAINAIKHSGYGADIREDDNGMKYVSIPCASDMW